MENLPYSWYKINFDSNDAVTGYVESVDELEYPNYTTQAVGFNQSTTIGLPASDPFGPIATALYLQANTYGVILSITLLDNL
ncbi:hypothetical protein [Chryseobacterium arachidis]|uniref:hypothetical protein n=1 Tax=Chryseobacterium arachidis TaxID=1416778 RepID=UPI00093491F6|nr:hypothetical protein [Chryseobacterium arachidis]